MFACLTSCLLISLLLVGVAKNWLRLLDALSFVIMNMCKPEQIEVVFRT